MIEIKEESIQTRIKIQTHPGFRWPTLPQVEEKDFRIPYFHVANDEPFLSSAIDRSSPTVTTSTHFPALRPSSKHPTACGGLTGEYYARGVSPASIPAEQVSHAFSYLSLSEQNSTPEGSGLEVDGSKHNVPGYRGVLTLVEAYQGGVTRTPILEESPFQDPYLESLPPQVG